MKLEARPQWDRLRRWRIVDVDSPGIGKEIIAENIRSERTAKLLAEAFNIVDMNDARVRDI